ncbi:MAG: LutB/LldF family L-lactate oxidation iron-sulfur protein [Phycisphaeraceae bacterium]
MSQSPSPQTAHRQPTESPLFPNLPYSIKTRTGKATKDIQLQQFVAQATLTKNDARQTVLPAVFGDKVSDIRALAGEIKQHTLDHLDHYVAEFVDNARAAGVQIHFARDAAEANRIGLAIAKNNGCKTCVKSKSMVTEETHLVPALEAAGIETVETDLGEFILQLDEDAPSHIVTPMIHKDRKAVARAFVRELGAEYTLDAEQLTGIARTHLREKYRQADLGVSGANFLVAESGSIVLCTNEGNGRFCTSAPRVHIAFAGIEKMIPRLEHLGVLLKVLARSSTGQPLTVYTHIVTGPKRDTEPDGPEQMHLILIDNGRTDVLASEGREMLRCIRCGACLNACPVYRKVGGHAYGAVYSGPIGAILTPMLKGLHNYPDLPEASSLCGACYEACPVKIDIPSQLIRLRKELVEQNLTDPADRLFMRAWAKSLNHPLTYRLGGWFQRTAFRFRARTLGTLQGGDPYSARGWVDHVPGPVAGWTSQRDMPTPPAKSFRHWWKKEHESKP